jgi:hypothetical protein
MEHMDAEEAAASQSENRIAPADPALYFLSYPACFSKYKKWEILFVFTALKKN